MKSVSSILPCRQYVQSVTNSHFVSHDLFIYYLNCTGMTSKMAITKVDKSQYSQVMAIFLLACKVMACRMKKHLIWMVPLHFGYFCQWQHFNGNLMVNNNILAFFLQAYWVSFYNSLYRGMCIKAPQWLMYFECNILKMPLQPLMRV